MSIRTLSIFDHTTASSPRPHILYIISVVRIDGSFVKISKRYSEFLELRKTLRDSEPFPPKRILVTAFLPSSWVDDRLVAERKSGLSSYLNALLRQDKYRDHPALLDFVRASSARDNDFSLEDALPFTLPRKASLEAQATITASKLIAAAYYPDWSADSILPESLDYLRFDILFFAFATPNDLSGISWDDGATSILKRLVSSARKSGKGTKIVLSIGGWGGSYWFSQAVSTSTNRTTFVNAAVSAVNTYGLDGIDIDWEYPNSQGAGNPHTSADAANFLLFLASLRVALGPAKIISAAVPHLPWLGTNGKPLTNVASYAAQLSYINIMNYDVWGASSTPGPNAPLGNLCGTSSQPQASAQAALTQWTSAGFPANKILLGLPLYGYVSKSKATTLTGIAFPPPGLDVRKYREQVLNLPSRSIAPSCPMTREKFDEAPIFLDGNHERSPATAREVSVEAAGDLSDYYGQQIPFNQIVALGALKKSSTGTYVQANGYTEGWDDCSDTPFLFNVARQTVVTYDDTYSLADKATYAKQMGMAGCFTWSLDQDDGYTLQDVIRRSLGK